jgi:hypothetical protein
MDHRAVKRATRPRLGFKSFEAGQGPLVGIEIMQMLMRGWLRPIHAYGMRRITRSAHVNAEQTTCR